MRCRPRWIAPLLLLAFALPAAAAPNERETKVRGDKRDVSALGSWIYNDLDAAVAEAKRSGKPILLVFRCIP